MSATFQGRTCTSWSADNSARRVPIGVIELTGLDTKTKIVAEHGWGAKFKRLANGRWKRTRKGEILKIKWLRRTVTSPPQLAA